MIYLGYIVGYLIAGTVINTITNEKNHEAYYTDNDIIWSWFVFILWPIALFMFILAGLHVLFTKINFWRLPLKLSDKLKSFCKSVWYKIPFDAIENKLKKCR